MWLSGVGIVCFATSYAIAFVLEASRLLFRSGIRGAAMIGIGGMGLFLHTVYLFYRAMAATGSPLSSRQDWCLVAAWVLAAIYLYLTYYHPDRSFGLFILPLVLGLIGAGWMLVDAQPYSKEPASRIWGAIHGVSLLLATVALLVGFAAGVMYLGQAYRLKHKLPPMRGLKLPSLEWLRRANSRAVGIAILTLATGILSGMVLNLSNSGPDGERLPWSDPVVLSTLLAFGWLVLCAGMGAFYRPAREGRKVALLTILSFLFLVLALAAVLVGETRHGGQASVTGVQGPEFRVQGSGFRTCSCAPSDPGAVSGRVRCHPFATDYLPRCTPRFPLRATATGGA